MSIKLDRDHEVPCLVVSQDMKTGPNGEDESLTESNSMVKKSEVIFSEKVKQVDKGIQVENDFPLSLDSCMTSDIASVCYSDFQTLPIQPNVSSSIPKVTATGKCRIPVSDTEQTLEEITLYQTRSIENNGHPGPQVMIKIKIGHKPVNTLVDLGAQVTVISEKVFRSLKKKPKILNRVNLHMACGDEPVPGFKIGPIPLRIGSYMYSHEVYVSSLIEDMVLGTDILHYPPVVRECSIDVIRGILFFDGQVIVGHLKFPNESEKVARVLVKKHVRIPPFCWANVVCKMEEDLPDYIIEPFTHKKYIAPKTLRNGNTAPILRIVNITDKPICLVRNEQVGIANSVASVA